MIATILRRSVLIPLAGLIFVSDPAAAADSSPWDADARAGARLIAGGPRRPGETVLRAGVEIRLGPGWKTYWRYPGDSGVPPRFDFSASRNVKEVTVLWPAPQSFADEGGVSIGYKEGVIFPLRVVPEDPRRPIDLKLKLDYAVCARVCVPAEAQAELVLSGGPSSFAQALAAAEGLVPKKAALGEGGPLAIRAVGRARQANDPQVIVEVVAPRAQAVELFAEGPTSDWALPVPKLLPDSTGEVRRFGFKLDGLPPGATVAGAPVILTAVSGTAAIEVVTHLD